MPGSRRVRPVPAGHVRSSRSPRSSLPFLLLFRLTCYYYRKAYYRCVLGVPAGLRRAGRPQDLHAARPASRCSFQNLHRYAFYAAVLISLINTWDAIRAFWGTDGFGFGLGNLVLLANVVLLWAYTLSCHSCRHIIGGRLKHFSKHPVRYKALGLRVQAQRPPHGPGLDDPGVARRHRLLRDGRLRRLVLRPALHQLRTST